MYSTTVYLYQQKQQVLLPDTSGAYFQRRWQPVYAKKLKVNRGVDNVILFEFINQDQKPVNISGSTITFRMIGTDGDNLLIAKDLVTLAPTYGRAKVTLTSEELDSIEQQTASWSLERASGDLYEAVFTDAYSSGRGQVDIVDSVYPDYVESTILEIPEPTKQNTPAASGDRNYTSMAYTANNTLTTFQLDFDNFTGNLKAQGSDTQLGPWYDIGSQTVYVNQNDRAYINIDGRHNWVRFEVNQYGYSILVPDGTQNLNGVDMYTFNSRFISRSWLAFDTVLVTVTGLPVKSVEYQTNLPEKTGSSQNYKHVLFSLNTVTNSINFYPYYAYLPQTLDLWKSFTQDTYDSSSFDIELHLLQKRTGFTIPYRLKQKEIVSMTFVVKNTRDRMLTKEDM